MTTYFGPAANGSGVAELTGYLNGVNYPGFLGIKTLITKTVGVSLAVAGRIPVGKEGPLCHIGANIGALVLYIPGMPFDFLKNDESKRLMVAAGAATGVSVAFGSPIGGTLFVYELSKPNTFWKFEMIWKVFMSCCLGTFTLATVSALLHHDGGDYNWSGSSLKFGSFDSTNNINIVQILPGSVAMGLMGGCLGTLFINLNTRINTLRKKIITKNWHKPTEAFVIAFTTASVFYFASYVHRTCKKFEINENDEEYINAWCPANYYDPMA